jgi:hypothetical protein
MFSYAFFGLVVGSVMGISHHKEKVEERKSNCHHMQTTFKVIPGTSWGSLPADMQLTWNQYQCDKYFIKIEHGTLKNTCV